MFDYCYILSEFWKYIGICAQYFSPVHCVLEPEAVAVPDPGKLIQNDFSEQRSWAVLSGLHQTSWVDIKLVQAIPINTSEILKQL